MTTSENTTPSWLAWARLMRISNLPSAFSNILMGFLLVNPSWQPWTSLTLLILASGFLYSAGMILNDVFDYQADSEHSPTRPLPSGQISIRAALSVGIAMCISGVGLAALAGWCGNGFAKPLTVSLVLVASIWLYDWILKKTWLAPIMMGMCRCLNVLLGASVFADEFRVHESASYLGFSGLVWWVAASIGIYVTGLTLFARTEHQVSRRWLLSAGLAVMITGIAGIALLPQRDSGLQLIDQAKFSGMFFVLILLISVTIVRSSAVAIWQPKGACVKNAIITALRSMIIFDACIVFLFSSGQIFYPLVVVSLIGISLALGMKIRST